MISGTYDLNHINASDWKLTISGATTLTETNLPTGTSTLEFTLKLSGDFTLTFPTYWDVIGDNYDGSVWNFLAIQVHNGDVGFEEVTAFLTNLG